MKLKTLVVASLSITALFGANDAVKRLQDSNTVLSEIMATSDKAIPQDLLDKAQCIVIVPGSKKVAFIIGGKFGRGFLSCRKSDGVGWSAPGGVKVEGGSAGFQIGVSETDVIMLVLNKGGADKLLSSKFTVGADASVAAGPVGRTSSAETDALLHAEILSWSRARGVFAGIALNGATLRPDDETNKDLYHKDTTNREIVAGANSPAAAAQLLASLNKYSSRKTN